MDELIGPREHRGAKLRLRQSTALPEHMRPHVRELIGFQSKTKGRGNATALLHKVCEEADKLNKTLLVMVAPFGDEVLDAEQLTKWYARFGFSEIQASPCLMARMPNSTPRVLN